MPVDQIPAPSLVDRLLDEYERTGVMPLIAGGDHEGDGDGEPPEDDTKPIKIEWTPEQQAEINRIAAREARSAADKARTELEAKLAADKSQADAEAKRKADEDRGAFDEVKTSLESERDTAISERDTLKTEREALAAYVTADIEAVTKAVNEAKDSPAAKAHLRYYPGDDADSLTLIAWAQKAKEDLPELTATERTPGNERNPNPATGHTTTDEDKRARASMRPRL